MGSAVARTCATSQIDQVPESERHRANRTASGEDDAQFGEGWISADDPPITAPGENPEREAG
jgi:hypothetical protein